VVVVKLKGWLASTNGIIVFSAILSLLMLVETMLAPWGPYFPVFVILSTGVPIFLKTYKFGSFRKVMAASWVITLGIFALDVVIDRGISGWLYEQVLGSWGLASDPFYSIDAAMDVMFAAVTQDLGISQDTAQNLFAFFALMWAPFGEELFYRGYMFGGLRKQHSFWKAALISALFFGIRHAFHFFYLWPDIPIVASAVWMFFTSLYAIYISYLYEVNETIDIVKR